MSATPESQPLLFLGEKRRHALISKASDSLRRWRQGWVREAVETFEVAVEPPTADGWTEPVAGVTTSVWALDAGAHRLAALLLPHATFAWIVQETGGAALDTGGSVSPESLAEQLEREVAQSLLAEFCQLGERDALTVARIAPDSLASWSRETRAWSLFAKCSSGRGCSVLLAASRVERLAPARAPGNVGTLESRREAVGGSEVSVRALVGAAAMSVSELAELAIDDVLVLDQHLTDPVALVSPATGAPIANGSLGRAGVRRAIKISTVPARN